jgi:hypothetical protein
MKNTAFCDLIASSRNSSTGLRRPKRHLPIREGRIGGRLAGTYCHGRCSLCGASPYPLHPNVLFCTQTVMSITFDEENHPEQDFLIESDVDCRCMQASTRSRATLRSGAHAVAPPLAGIVIKQGKLLSAGHQHPRRIAVQNRTVFSPRPGMTVNLVCSSTSGRRKKQLSNPV